MRLQHGDLVTILPYKDLARLLDADSLTPSGCYIARRMKEVCGQTFAIKRLDAVHTDGHRDVGWYYLDDDTVGKYVFPDEILTLAKDVYDDAEIKYSFDELMAGEPI